MLFPTRRGIPRTPNASNNYPKVAPMVLQEPSFHSADSGHDWAFWGQVLANIGQHCPTNAQTGPVLAEMRGQISALGATFEQLLGCWASSELAVFAVVACHDA